MDFFPGFGRPYYYTQGMPNRYMSQMYRNSYYDTKKVKEAREEVGRTSREEEGKEDDRFSKDTQNREGEPIFEIAGLKLYFDDMLIIALIFFLYNEGVRDNLLFISLILILLS